MGAKRVKLTVSGEVQGVGYRFFAMKTAKQLGILGWVRNTPDGTVALEIEGEEQVLNEYIFSLQKKHPWARVNDIQKEWQAFTGNFQSFEITG
ncbi:acylphosphatase [Elusimicrobiota bacterium]